MSANRFLPRTEREALELVMSQTEGDLASAHVEICKLQGLDPEKHTWPEWTPQANTLRWFAELRKHFALIPYERPHPKPCHGE